MQFSKPIHYLMTFILSCHFLLFIAFFNIIQAEIVSTASANQNVNQNANKNQDQKRKLLPQASPENLSPWLTEIPLKPPKVGILPEEADLYYKMLAYARDVDPNVFNNAVQSFLTERWQQSKYKKLPIEKFPVYVDIYQNQKLYQGRPVTMTGRVQRSVISKADSNDFGLENICESWLFTEDSQSNPTVVISSSLPKDFPIGEQAVDRVTITGYLYRMYTYDARDKKRFAPMIMAHEIKWVPESEANEKSNSILKLLLFLLAIILLGVLLGCFLLWFSRKNLASQKSRAQVLTDSSSPNFDFDQPQEK